MQVHRSYVCLFNKYLQSLKHSLILLTVVFVTDIRQNIYHARFCKCLSVCMAELKGSMAIFIQYPAACFDHYPTLEFSHMKLGSLLWRKMPAATIVMQPNSFQIIVELIRCGESCAA